MKKVIIASVIFAMVVGLGIAFGDKPQDPDDGSYKGNGAPSGPHFNLNIIGVPKDKINDMKDNGGHVIFVKLDGRSEINLQEGEPYAVLDKNGMDEDGALFQLPNPDPDYDGVTSYSVWARALGKPGGSATMTTCAYIDDILWCSEDLLVVTRPKGKSTFKDVSRQLLYIYVDLTDDDKDNPKRYPLFDPRLEGYFWDYDNDGLKILQLRFYEIHSGPYDDIAEPPAA